VEGTPSAGREGSAPSFSEDIWPKPQEEKLLCAGLSRSGSALVAWEEWRDAPQNELDPRAARLLPLLYLNLRRLGVDDPVMEPLERIHRTVREENDERLRAASEVLSRLHRAGVETLLLKGSALLSAYYGDGGARPMADIDVAVPLHRAEQAVDELSRTGWVPEVPVSRDVLQYRHSINFSNRCGSSLDLHWHVLLESCQPGADDDFWEAAIPTRVGDVPTRTLVPADLLLQIVSHGLRWSTAPTLHWIADATTLIRVAEDRIDWERLVEQAACRNVALRLHAGLRYLASRLEVEIPEPVLAQLAELGATRMERAEMHLRLRDRDAILQERTGPLKLVLVDYWRLRMGTGLLRSLIGLPAYLRFRWGIKAPR